MRAPTRQPLPGRAVRCGLVLLGVAALAPAQALTPLPDSSPAFFAGEWAGAAGQGGYCYLALDAGGTGVVLIDGGSGDWLGARLRWHNDRQSLQVDEVMPLAFSAQERMMPLPAFTLRSGLNQSLALAWGTASPGCQLQKTETAERHLQRARQALRALPAAGRSP
jgi:hypothetical protein